MKGIIFNVFEEFIAENFGAEAYEDILEKADSSTQVFVGPATYPDEDLFKLVGLAVEKSGLELSTALQLFGKFLFDKLASGYPQFLESQTDIKLFLKSVQNMIHVEVAKMYPESNTPHFEFRDEFETDSRLVIHYISQRNLPDLMAGLIDGAAEYFNVKVSQSWQAHSEQKNCWIFDLQIEG